MSNRKSGPSKRSLVVITLLCVSVVGSLAAYVKLAPADKVPASEHRTVDPNYVRKSPEVKIGSHKLAEGDGQVLVMTPHFKGEELSFTSAPIDVPSDEDPKVFAVNQYLRSTKLTSESARLLSVDVKDGVAAMSFNADFQNGYGTDDERTMLEGLQRTMGQFPDVQKLEILVDGHRIESLGNIEISEPIEAIRPSNSSGSSDKPKPR